ncbi:alpha/beta fold hydrolase [Paremcibacter congregatus]|uniref:Alpha/beta hydrolase n=1 Tax=Paremcibacter congregatus TaxID=2043170 RepID=A0A2G4YW27_9PROT|nr:alpha/beta fold hydrolase [Paremcibacter congregatus]PHZ86544.1 hypothetical protein CRD36_01285 [Paremcibacter congregatus]QDE26348.1 alpha/beta hydrolase [Paremcibacter congregatus]
MTISKNGLIIAALLSLFSMGSAAAEENTALPSNASELVWGDCPVTIPQSRCGMLTVPENWNNPAHSRKIKVRVVVLEAHNTKNRAEDPVTFITGGPGVSIFLGLNSIAQLQIRENRDIIAMEPRGYGYSDPWLGCENVESLPDCYAKAQKEGIDVTQYNTTSSVKDLEALRKAMNYDRWNVLGVSYGTFLASQYARMYPDSIRAFIMDSPDPLHTSYQWSKVAALNSLERIFTACAADTACGATFPNLRKRFIETMIKLEEKPVTVNGKSFGVKNAFAPIFNAQYMSSSLHRTPILVDALARGDYALLNKVSNMPTFDIPDGLDISRINALGLNASVLCREEIFFPPDPETRVAYTAPWPKKIIEMITPEGWDYDKRCAAWPVPKDNGDLNTPVQIDVPSMVLVGAYDPVTPPEFAEAMLLHMSKGTLVQDPSSAHAISADNRNSCVQNIMSRFITAPTEHLDVSCLLNRKPVHWLLPDEVSLAK